ncbi:ATP-binding cassette (ABC) Superfamily [Phytophthora palmivora]|uniref:ATP-binding cassette (ABC) Superfamily n=1 Tax=Phytophthora palmivora TaxID=4796 RepID=A0A2P4WYR1_9STRA|nr:ATP-binding cassette (ABC) Superfamily [Phytophthora palmivora]
MGSKKNYLLLDWLDSQSIVSVLTVSVGFLPMLQGIPPMRAMALCCSLSSSWAHVHLAGGHTSVGAYERHLIKGVPLFIENIEAARCEITRLRKKSDTKGAGEYLLSCTGRWVPHKGCPVKELQAEAQLEFVLIQRDLRVQFAHLVVKRQLVTEMEVLRSSPAFLSEKARRPPYPVQLLRSSALLTKLLPLDRRTV